MRERAHISQGEGRDRLSRKDLDEGGGECTGRQEEASLCSGELR